MGQLEHLPGVERDIAIVVHADQPAGELEALIRAHGGSHLRTVTLFDQYRGSPLADDEKSLAYRLRYETLDDAAGRRNGRVDGGAGGYGVVRTTWRTPARLIALRPVRCLS